MDRRPRWTNRHVLRFTEPEDTDTQGDVTAVAVKIKLKRIGKIRVPQYRIVVADARTARDGRAIEEIGIYQPKQDPSLIRVDSDRVQYWLGVGAQPTESVLAILKVTGDWQTFKGLPGAEGTLRTAAPKSDKSEAFNAAAKEAVSEKDRVAGVKAKAAKKAAEARAAEAAGDSKESKEAKEAKDAAPEKDAPQKVDAEPSGEQSGS